MINIKNIKRKIKSISGNSLAEFAVTTAMMATLATTAAPRFSGIGEGAKEKKTGSKVGDIKSFQKALAGGTKIPTYAKKGGHVRKKTKKKK